MDKFAKLMQDIGILWEKYRMMYLNGMLNTLGLALAATAIGCVIGLLCGISIPSRAPKMIRCPSVSY